MFNRHKRDQELQEELQAHLAMAIRDRIERGEDPREAELAARREFGNRTLIEESTREVWGWTAIQQASQDLRYALRGMRRSPGFTAVAIASLALGIGANTAIFSLMYTVMLRALPVSHPEQLVELLQKYPGEPRGNGWWSRKSFEYYRDNNHVFSAITGMSIDNVARLQSAGAEPETKVSEFVLENYFTELGIQPVLGRMIGPKDDPGCAVLSWTLWTSRFHQDPNVLGKQITVNDAPAVIIGVAPREFTGLRVNARTDLWLPVKPNAGLALVARLKPGVTIAQARAEMALLFRFTIEERATGSKDPQIHKLQVELEPASMGLSGLRDRVGQPLTILMAVVGVLLLLACLNIAGMLLARSASRSREMALRLGLGASRGRLVRQMLTESLLLSLAGTLAGAVVAYAGTALLLPVLDSGRDHERIQLNVHTDSTVLLFSAGIAIVTGLLFGLAPAWSAFRCSPAFALRQTGRSTETTFSRFVGKGLLAAQVALSVLLLSSASLFIAHLAQLKTADLGFRRDHVLLVRLDPSRSGITGEKLAAVYRGLLTRMETIPGVSAVSLSAPTPLHGAGASGFGSVEGFHERPEDRRWISISYVAPKYFETLGTPILKGRDFTFQDQKNPRVAVINQTVAQHFFPDSDPIGKRITMENVTLSREPATYEIIGVSANAHYMEIKEPERRSIYLPAFRGDRVIAGTFVLRTYVRPESIAEVVKKVVRDSASRIHIAQVTTLETQIDASIVLERLMAMLSGFFALLGALLAGIGLYGLLAYSVTRRTSEFGIRMALGATSGGVIRIILKEALLIVSVGLMLGVPMAIWGRTLAATLVQDLTTGSAASFALGAIAIILVALMAAYVPALRAARVDPMESLRHE